MGASCPRAARKAKLMTIAEREGTPRSSARRTSSPSSPSLLTLPVELMMRQEVTGWVGSARRADSGVGDAPHRRAAPDTLFWAAFKPEFRRGEWRTEKGWAGSGYASPMRACSTTF